VDEMHCLGCGVCVPACPDGALGLVRRPVEQVEAPPLGSREWLELRAASRGMDLGAIL